jgi:hypothetical protein
MEYNEEEKMRTTRDGVVEKQDGVGRWESLEIGVKEFAGKVGTCIWIGSEGYRQHSRKPRADFSPTNFNHLS